MANFEKAITVVLKNEGGFVNNPSDPGGATNFGISLEFYKTIIPDADIEDIRNLTKEMAIEVYQRQFWDKNKLGMIADQRIATKVFDFSVNMGAVNAIKCLQRAILATNNRKVDQDGIIGQNTLYAANHSPPDCVLAALKSEAAGYYRCLATRKPTMGVFLNGWLSRAYSDV